MKRLFLLLIIPTLLFTGCSSGKTMETATSRIPTHIIFDGKGYFDFNATIAYGNRIYCITNENLSFSELDHSIGKIKRDVTSHALINGDYGFYTLKKKKSDKPYQQDAAYQQIYVKYKNNSVKGNGIYKITGTGTNEAIALKYSGSDYVKFVYLGEMNAFYKAVQVLIKPIVFVPILVVIFIMFLVCIVFFE